MWAAPTAAFHCCKVRLPRADDGGGSMRKRDKDSAQKSKRPAHKQLQFYKQPLFQFVGKYDNTTENILRNS